MCKRLLLELGAMALLASTATAQSGAPAGGVAEEPSTLHTLSLEELLGTPIISASKVGQRAMEAPSTVEVVTRDAIHQYGWISLNDILYAQPGFGPAADYDRRTVASRGVWESWLNNHLLLLVDGIPMNENTYGSALTSEVTPLFMVKNVEVLRGPGSALYGSNATNGVITVNTLSADDLKDGGEVHVRGGDGGTRLVDWVGGFKNDRLFSVVAGLAGYATDGNEVLDYDGSGRGVDAGGAGTLQRLLTNDHRSNWYGWLKLEGERGLRGLTIQVHEQSWSFQTGHGWAFWIPDQREQLEDQRTAVSVSYKRESGRLAQEYALRWQGHRFAWNMRYYPNDAFDGFYPSGAWEHVDSSLQDLFARAQLRRTLPRNANLIAGLEADGFLYSGDRAHFANFNPDTGSPNPGGRFEALGPYMDTVEDHPMLNLAPYAQYSSGELLGSKTKVTLGARVDHNRLTVDPGVARLYLGSGRTGEVRSFSQFSPRLAVVFLPRPNLSIKLLAGKAFRPPSFAEIGGAHTYNLGSDPVNLAPETVKTGELGVDWRISHSLNWRTNVFQTTYANFISASSENLNFSANVFTLKNRGLETELLFGGARFSGFLNYAHAQRVDETILDPLIAASTDQVTWEPAHKVNAGLIYSRGAWKVGLSSHYEGRVLRRSNEVGVEPLILGVDRTIDLDQYRPRELGAWVTLDGKISYSLSRTPSGLSLHAGGTNLLGTRRNVLVKTGPFPFDYPQEGRRLYAGLGFSY